MKKFLPAALLLACGTGFAQTPAPHTLPDGSTDMYIGAGIIDGPEYEGSNQRWVRWALSFQAQWSNGIFISNSRLGMHLSDNPDIEYGPLLVLESTRPQNTPPRSDGLGSTYLGPALGGFYNYNLPFGVQLASDLLFATGRYHGTVVADLDLRAHSRIANHHSLAYWTGVTWTNASATQTEYGININLPDTGGPGEELSATNGPAPATSYVTTSRIEDVHAGVTWNWDLSSDWLISSRLYATHMVLESANSPLVEQRNNVTVSTALAYRF